MFFHAQASEKRKQNNIVGIWDEQGRWCDDEESIAQAAISYFDNIYSSSHPSQIEEVTDAIPSKVTDEINESLIREFTSRHGKTGQNFLTRPDPKNTRPEPDFLDPKQKRVDP